MEQELRAPAFQLFPLKGVLCRQHSLHYETQRLTVSQMPSVLMTGLLVLLEHPSENNDSACLCRACKAFLDCSWSH